MSKNAILFSGIFSGILGLLSFGCGEPRPLPGLGTNGDATDSGVVNTGGPGGRGGPGEAAGIVGDAAAPGASDAAPPRPGAGSVGPVPTGGGGGSLAGIWSGNVNIDHPDFYGAPIDQMTIEIGNDGKLEYSGFEQFGYQASFGAPPDEIPLAGSAIAHVVKGAGFFLRFTVLSADWQVDHFAFTYTGHSDGLGMGETPETPFTDLTIALTGTLVDGKMHVHWTEQGSEYTAPLQAIADGDLTR